MLPVEGLPAGLPLEGAQAERDERAVVPGGELLLAEEVREQVLRPGPASRAEELVLLRPLRRKFRADAGQPGRAGHVQPKRRGLPAAGPVDAGVRGVAAERAEHAGVSAATIVVHAAAESSVLITVLLAKPAKPTVFQFHDESNDDAKRTEQFICGAIFSH